MPDDRLTALFVDGVKAPERGQRTYFDHRVPGFGLRVSQGGRKTWVLVYRHQGRLRWYTIGTYPILSLADARNLAKSRLSEVQKGTDVASVKQQATEADTFAQLTHRYLTEH